MNSRDIHILERIVAYCQEIEHACDLFGKSYEQFENESVFRNACCMCILQIGELTGKLSDEAKAETASIPWREIRSMRNICAHNYGSINRISTWATILEDIPMLTNECKKHLTDRL